MLKVGDRKQNPESISLHLALKKPGEESPGSLLISIDEITGNSYLVRISYQIPSQEQEKVFDNYFAIAPATIKEAN